MSSPEEAEKAKEALNNTDFDGRPLMVDEARPLMKSIKGDKGDKQNRHQY